MSNLAQDMIDAVRKMPNVGDNSIFEVRLMNRESVKGRLASLGNGSFLEVSNGRDEPFCVPVEQIVWIRDTPR